MNDKPITIALAGNPNSGKTTIFNVLTGTRQKVGNWPGVTVEKKEGRIHHSGYDLTIIDLPGTYSLTPFSIEEIVARDYILDERPDVVIDIIDSSNLERSLYLATQLRELDCKVVFALNMTDLSRKRGIRIDAKKMARLLDVPVVNTVGNRQKGIDELLQQAIETAKSDQSVSPKRKVRYSKDIETAIEELLPRVTELLNENSIRYNARWTTVKLLENDRIVRQRILEKGETDSTELLQQVEHKRKALMDRFDDDIEIVMTDERYGFIAGIIKEVHTTSTLQRVDVSRNIDRILTNRYLGFPIFIFFIWAMFQVTFSLGAYPMDWLDTGIGIGYSFLDRVLPESILKELLLDGIISGVGSVIIFLPNILILFFFIALFEDSGYMARSAFLMDRIMHLLGLHGKSFIPMLMGFGCNVPAVMATRTLESEKDRILTILITPFMSCSAKLPIYIVLAGTFFAARAGSVIFGIYLLGIFVSIVSGRLFHIILFKGEDAPFVMELPPYRAPMLKSLLIHMWDRSKLFLKKMGGIILIGSIVVWALSAFPRNIEYSADYNAQIQELHETYATLIASAGPAASTKIKKERDAKITALKNTQRMERSKKSYMGVLGRFVAPVFAPIGLNWQGSISLMTGFVAKEIVVSTLGILYGAADEGRKDSHALENSLKASGMTPLSALAMMAFVLLYVPCLATVATIRKETNSIRWTLFSISYSTGIAWITAFCIYQGGRFLGLG